MRDRIRRHLADNFVGYVALIIAVAGVPMAWALGKNSVGPEQLKPNAVRSSDVKDEAIKGGDVDERTLGKVASAGHADSATNAQSAVTAENAMTAGSAQTAESAAVAQNAKQLDGLDSSQFAPGTAEPWREVGTPGQPAFATGTCGAPCYGNFDPANVNTVAFFRDPWGIVHLKGLAECLGGTAPPCFAGDRIFSLPEGYRPDRTASLSTVRSSNFTPNVAGRVDVDASGDVAVATNESVEDWVSLDGLSFRCAPPGSNGCP